MPILIVGTYRDVELDVERPLAKTLEELVRRRLVHRISLSRLPKEGVAAMLRALAGRETPPSLVDAVFAETEGNCFFVEEVFQHLLEEGKLFDPNGEWRSEVRIGEVDVPEGVRLVLGRRLGRLSEGARRALAGAAVIGRSFTFDLVEALGEVSVDALLDGIEEAHRARLLSSSEDAFQARFTFAHELIRQTLLSGLSLPRRQRLHLRVAEAIERVFARDLDAHTADLAHHLYQAGAAADPDKTVTYLVRSGDRAMEGAAFEDALRAYDRAVGLQPDDDRRGRADLLVKLGFAQRSLGRLEQSVASWREALDLYAELDDSEAAATVCWEIAYQVSWSGRAIEGVEFIQRGLMAIGEARTAVRGFLLASAGGFVAFLGDHPGGTAMVDEAVAIASELGDRHLQGYARLSRAIIDYAYSEHAAILEAAPLTTNLLRGSSSPYDLASFLGLVEWSHLATGDVARSIEIHDELEPLAQRIGHSVAFLLTRRAEAFRRFRDEPSLDEYEEFARWDMDFCRDNQLEWITNAHGFAWVAAMRRGRWEEALEHARRCAETEPPGGFHGWTWPNVALTLAHLGRHDEVRRMVEDAKAMLPSRRPATWGSWALLAGMIEALAMIGDREEAAALYPRILETEGTGALLVRAYDGRLTRTVAGIGAHAGREWDEAERHFGTAIGQADGFPGVHEGAEARRFYAAMLIERDEPGDRERARELLEAACEIYTTIGMTGHLELAETMLKGI